MNKNAKGRTYGIKGFFCKVFFIVENDSTNILKDLQVDLSEMREC